jgi:hypothetical protein
MMWGFDDQIIITLPANFPENPAKFWIHRVCTEKHEKNEFTVNGF